MRPDITSLMSAAACFESAPVIDLHHAARGDASPNEMNSLHSRPLFVTASALA